jgi:hypothetical protein
MKKQPSAPDKFYSGIIAALEVIASHDNEVIFDEVVNRVDLDELLDFAKRNELLECSGLKQYGYVKGSRQAREYQEAHGHPKGHRQV